MTRPTKRAQVEALGWKLEAIPRHFAAGLIRNSQTGYMSPAYDDYRHPAAWIVTSPPDRNLPPRRFNTASPIPAVRWAYDQAMAAPPPAEVGGVAGLVLLAAAAGKSGVVVEGVGDPPFPALPDGELLHLCREIEGSKRIIAAADGARPCPWSDRPAFELVQARVYEARRERDRLVPLALDLEATTPAGVLAKARVVLELFALNGSSTKKAAMRGLVEDLARVLGQSTTTV